MSPSPCAARGVYLITPDEPDTGLLLERVRPLLAAATWLQYRNKTVDAATAREQAQALQLLRDAAALGVPRVAIGGLAADNIAPLVEAGADLVAIISGVFAADDPVAALRACQACFA